MTESYPGKVLFHWIISDPNIPKKNTRSLFAFFSEMIEAVGHEFMEEFFRCCESVLAEDGLLVLQVMIGANTKLLSCLIFSLILAPKCWHLQHLIFISNVFDLITYCWCAIVVDLFLVHIDTRWTLWWVQAKLRFYKGIYLSWWMPTFIK